MYGQIYVITNTVNGKRYVGQTKRTLAQRWQEHVGAARRQPHKSPLYYAIQKYGAAAFRQETLIESDSPEQLNKDEQFYIFATKALSEGYNVRQGGNNSPVAPVTRAKMSASSLGKPKSPEHCANISKAYKDGRAIHADVSGENNPFFGKKHTAETLSKLRGRTVSPETRRKIGESHSGEKSGKYRHDVSTQFLKEQYESGTSSYALSKIVNMNAVSIVARLRKAGVQIRKAA